MKNFVSSLPQQRKRKVEQLQEIPPSNDKWSFISSMAKINEVHSVPMSVLEQRTTSRQELDLQEYSKEELQELKMKDPFMYYSIPGVRSAKLALKDIDLSDVSALCQGGTNAKSSSRPSERSKGSSNNTIVVRRSALSLECHSDIFLAYVFDDLSVCDDDEDEDFSPFDDLDVLLRAN